MEPFKRPAAVPDRQISFLFEQDGLEGLSAQERDTVVAMLAQILMQAKPVQVGAVLNNLVDVARQRGFVDVEVIDDDLGRSASGL